LLESGDFLEALAGCDGVDEQEALACTHVLLAHGAVLFLAGGIEHIEQGDLIVNNALLAVGVCTEDISGCAMEMAVAARFDHVPSIVGSYSSTKWL
jgi:hypothetical protein